MSKKSFPLRISKEDRARSKRLAEELGVSENRLYNELIHDGLLMREPMAYLSKLQAIAASTTREDALAVLAKASDDPPASTDGC